MGEVAFGIFYSMFEEKNHKSLKNVTFEKGLEMWGILVWIHAPVSGKPELMNG